MDFSKRSYEKEMLDGEDIPFEDIKKNMQELEFINAKLGGHAITMKGFRALAGNAKSLTVCEIGCGGGDNIKVINDFCRKKNIDVNFIGIDINSECIEYALENCKGMNNLQFITSDYELVDFKDNKPDIIYSSLFCHHLNDNEIQQMLQWNLKNASKGFFINDLHRTPLAYHSIKMLTQLFSNSYLVKNDAPVSVKRGFVKEDWESALENAGITKYSLTWQWAFRWLIVVRTNNSQ